MVWPWVSWVTDGCGCGWVSGGVAVGFVGCKWVWPWVSGGSQVRFRGLQMGVAVGFGWVSGAFGMGHRGFTVVEVLWVFFATGGRG